MSPDDLASASAAWAKLPAGADDSLTLCAGAVCALIATLPVGQAGKWSESTRLGAIMLTARLHRRRNSPSGVESLTEMGATYVSRYDSDIARMLRLDAFMGPVAV